MTKLPYRSSTLLYRGILLFADDNVLIRGYNVSLVYINISPSWVVYALYDDTITVVLYRIRIWKEIIIAKWRLIDSALILLGALSSVCVYL